MKHPQDDLEARTPVWDALQMIFMDTDPDLLLDEMATVCARSPYELEELEAILFCEVLPALRFNLFMFPAPEWQGFETSSLVQRILQKHRFGRRPPLVLRGYTRAWWTKLERAIISRRSSPTAEHDSRSRNDG